jgi:hypothetical protein
MIQLEGVDDSHVFKVTRVEYKAFRFGDFALVVDGVRVPPAARYRLDEGGERVVDLVPDELAALRTMMSAPDEAFPWRDLLPSASPTAGTQRWSTLRKKLGPAAACFETRDRGAKARHYAFKPTEQFRCCLIELATAEPEPAKTHAQESLPKCERCGPFPYLSPYHLFDAEHHDAVTLAQQEWRSRHARHTDQRTVRDE